jgi:hypothetical protein
MIPVVYIYIIIIIGMNVVDNLNSVHHTKLQREAYPKAA